MNVAELSQDEILDALDEIIANTVSCINDHELGTDGCGGNVRQRVIICLEANEGKNNACAHCGTKIFPNFPSNEIVKKAIELISEADKKKLYIQVMYDITTSIMIVLDRIRFISLAHGTDDGTIDKFLADLQPYSSILDYVKTKIEKIESLRKKAVAMCYEKDSNKKQLMNHNFLNDFTAEKKDLTDFRLEILREIKECLSS